MKNLSKLNIQEVFNAMKSGKNVELFSFGEWIKLSPSEVSIQFLIEKQECKFRISDECKDPKRVVRLMLDLHPSVTLAKKEDGSLFLCNERNIDNFNLNDYFIISRETGRTIIDFVNGKEILENENE